MFISSYADTNDDTLVTLLLRVQPHACSFDMNARFGGAALGPLAVGVHRPVEQQCGRADPTRWCI
eukprot:2611403-Pleurochrysis_carterae.AAC.2